MLGHPVGRRRTAAVAAGLALVLGTAACGGGDDSGGSTEGGPVTLNFTWWGNDDRAARYQEAIALFEEQNPDITINGTFADFESYWTSRSTEAASRSLPDVLQMDLSYLAEYSQNGHLLDLGEHVGQEIDLSGWDESLVEAGVLDGQQVGIPTSTNTLALFTNPALLTAAGAQPPAEDATWEEHAEWVASVSEAGATNAEGQPVYGSADFTGVFWVFMQWLVQQGVEPFAEDGSFGFDEDDVREFLELGSDLRADQAVYPMERTTQLAPLTGFDSNEVASEFTWDNFLAGYVTNSGSQDIALNPLPDGPEGEKSMFFKPSMLLSAGAGTEHPAEAAQFIDFLLTEPEVGRIFGTSKGVPADEAQREAMQLEEGSVDARVTAYEEAVAEHVTEPVPTPIRGFGAIESEWLRLSEELQYGSITVDEFVEQWFAEAEAATGQ